LGARVFGLKKQNMGSLMSEPGIGKGDSFEDLLAVWVALYAIPTIIFLLIIEGDRWWERATGLDYYASLLVLFFSGLGGMCVYFKGQD
jgi:hypothetical protein